MLFKILSGSHFQNGKNYKKDDIIESSMDLASVFVNKFVQIEDIKTSPPPISGGSVPYPEIPLHLSDENKSSLISSFDFGQYGEEATDEFPIAAETNCRVFRKNTGFFVADAEDGELLNQKKLAKKDVEPFLKQYIVQ